MNENVRQLAQYLVKTESNIIVAMIPASYAALYKKVTTTEAKEKDIGTRIVEMIESETKIKIKSEEDLDRVNDYYKRFGFLTVNDYILFYITRQITPYIKVCRSCKQYKNGICLTYGYAMCATNWGCKNFM